jgi:hypothetical protein
MDENEQALLEVLQDLLVALEAIANECAPLPGILGEHADLVDELTEIYLESA